MSILSRCIKGMWSMNMPLNPPKKTQFTWFIEMSTSASPAAKAVLRRSQIPPYSPGITLNLTFSTSSAISSVARYGAWRPSLSVKYSSMLMTGISASGMASLALGSSAISSAGAVVAAGIAPQAASASTLAMPPAPMNRRLRVSKFDRVFIANDLLRSMAYVHWDCAPLSQLKKERGQA